MTWFKKRRPAEVAALHARIAELDGRHRIDVATIGRLTEDNVMLTAANRRQELRIMELEHTLEGIAAQCFAFEERFLAAHGDDDTDKFQPVVQADPGASPGIEYVHKATRRRIRLERRRANDDGWLAVFVGGSGREWWIADEDLANEYRQVEVAVDHAAA